MKLQHLPHPPNRLLALLVLFTVTLALLLSPMPAQAQGVTPLAFVNNSGQLVVTSGNGSIRWIVTNPGESLALPMGFTWSPDGRRIFYAVNTGGGVSLRVGEVSSQQSVEIATSGSGVSGGEWFPDGTSVLVAENGSAFRLAINGSSASEVASGVGQLISPYNTDRPNLQIARSLSPDGSFLFFWNGGGYTLQAVGGGGVTLPLSNDANARSSGIWADNAPLVAYWGFSPGGTSSLAVTNAANGDTIILDSGRTAPIAPAAWRPGTSQLVYRDASNVVRLADVGCLLSGCGGNPLESGVGVAPATASDMQFGVQRDWLFYRDGEGVFAVNLGCVGSNNCLQSAVSLGGNSAPQTWLHVAGNTLAYTAYTQDARNPADREVRVVNLNCLGSPPSCQPTGVVAGMTAGLVSPDGGFVTADQNGAGLNSINLSSGTVVNLSGSVNLTRARWR